MTIVSVDTAGSQSHINSASVGSSDTDPARGLAPAEAARRFERVGPNALTETKSSAFERLMRYFWGPIPWMIEAAATLSAALGDWADFGIILTLLLVNAGVDFWQESKAGSAIEALKARLAPSARVLRDGTWRTLPARELVPGDIILLKLGDIAPADVRLITGDYLSADESALTGESLPVDKKAGDTAYSGSIVKLGEMTGLVTATGMNTYFGKTAQLVQSAEVRSHFQRAILNIGNFLIITTIGLVILILLVALFRETPFWQTLKFCLILTVAAIPVALLAEREPALLLFASSHIGPTPMKTARGCSMCAQTCAPVCLNARVRLGRTLGRKEAQAVDAAAPRWGT